MNQSNITVQELTVQATLSGNPEYIMHAIAMDPLTSAVCTLKEIREMVAEMLGAQREWLPQFTETGLRSVPLIDIPENITPIDVPLDPALAIVHRFGELAQKKY
jgi:alpha-galactosidase